jgi:hypothetical protein
MMKFGFLTGLRGLRSSSILSISSPSNRMLDSPTFYEVVYGGRTARNVRRVGGFTPFWARLRWERGERYKLLRVIAF